MAAPAASPGDSDGSADPPSRQRAVDDVGIDVDLIKVLASDTRRDVLRLLGSRRHTLTELAEALNLKKATILEHLQKLVQAGLIRKLDDGERLWVYYELTWRGKRIVHPERTRFYLILASSAAALVLVGAVVAASAMLGGFGERSSFSEDASAPAEGRLVEDMRASPPVVVWLGLDASVAIPLTGPAPPGSTLVIEDPAGPIELPVVDGRASLSAAEVDRLSEGRHSMLLRTDAGDLALPGILDARTPPIALAPLAIPEGQESTLVLSVGVPGLPVPTDLAVRVDGALVPLSELGRERTFTLTPPAPGEIDVRVGRLARMSVLVLPDLRADALHDNGTLVLNVSDGRGPLANASATLDALDLGTTDANGTLRAAWPEPGERALRLLASDGRAREIAVTVTATSLTPASPRLSLSAYSDPGALDLSAHVDVENRGPANETVTLLARLDGQTIASARVHVPANGRAEVPLAAKVALTSPVTIEAYGATPIDVRARFLGYDSSARGANATANTPPAGAPTTSATPTPVPTAPAVAEAQSDDDGFADVAYALSSVGRGPDATTTLYPPPSAATVSPTDAAASERAAPAVPGPGAALVVLALALVAIALARRR